MELQIIELEGLTKITVSGELDASTAINVDTAFKLFLEKKQLKLIIDCTELDYISSAGVGVFISFIDDFKDKGGDFIFFNMQESVENVFNMLGLNAILSIVANENEAKNKLI